jgi:hypothetical protein
MMMAIPSSGMLRRVVWQKLTDISEDFRGAITLMDTVSTSETLVTLYQTTRRNIPQDRHLHIRCRIILKFHLMHGRPFV